MRGRGSGSWTAWARSAAARAATPANAEDAGGTELSAARAALELVNDAVLIADVSGRVLAWNRAAEEITGYRGDALAGTTLADLLNEVPQFQVGANISPVSSPDPAWAGELVLRGANGTQNAATVWHKFVGGSRPDLLRQVLLISRGVMGVESRGRGTGDQLTGLPNREVVREYFIAQQKVAAHDGRRMAFFWIDVDRFNSVNDTIGHRGGDRFLRHIAGRIASAIGGSNLLCRVAGNEFLAVATNVDTATRVSALVERIRTAISEDFFYNGEALRRTVSIGITLYPDDGVDFDELARKADMAKRLARRGGRDRVLFHSEQMSNDFERRQALERALSRAIDNDAVFMHYQPQIELGTGRIVGLEALARWTWSGHGAISPQVFIPIAEESGMILTLGPKIFRLVCAQARAWHLAGLAVPISVNLSPVEIAAGDADTRILEIIEQSGLPPELLTVEITESGLIDETPKTEVTIANLRDSFVGLSIDDFLTGYSNFAYIRRFRASHLKIDRSFVDGIDIRPDNQAIVRAAVQMAATLGVETIAEGVETEQEASTLRLLGCRFAQGYLFARPLLAEELQPLLVQGAIHPSTSTEH